MNEEGWQSPEGFIARPAASERLPPPRTHVTFSLFEGDVVNRLLRVAEQTREPANYFLVAGIAPDRDAPLLDANPLGFHKGFTDKLLLQSSGEHQTGL